MKDGWKLVVDTLGIGSALWKSVLAAKPSALHRVLSKIFFCGLFGLLFGINLGSSLGGPVANVDIRSIRNGLNDHIVAADGNHLGLRDAHAPDGLFDLLPHPQMKVCGIEGVGFLKLGIVGLHKLVQQIRGGSRLPRFWKRYFEGLVKVLVFVVFVIQKDLHFGINLLCGLLKDEGFARSRIELQTMRFEMVGNRDEDAKLLVSFVDDRGGN